MIKQLCFRGLKPTRPTMKTPSVARRIAERIVAEVNLDDFYWPEATLPDRIADVAEEIIAMGNPRTVFTRLAKVERLRGESGLYGERETPNYTWDGIDEHCRHIAAEIAAEEIEAAGAEWKRTYEE